MHLLSALGLIALCLVVYLPGFFALPPVDRDESRFAQASRQMFESVALPSSQRDPALHSGGLVIPRVQGRDRLSKPPLIYWLQASSAAVLTFGRPLLDSIWMYRVPSLLAAIASVLITWRLGTSLFDSRTGRVAAALLACCPIVAWEARQARADMVLLALNTSAMLALWRVFAPKGPAMVARGEASRSDAEPLVGASAIHAPEGQAKAPSSWHWPILFWLSLSLAILTKGPITPLIAAFTALSLSLTSHRWRWLLQLRFELGVPILLTIVAPWVITVAERVGWDAYFKTITDETLGRVASARESHWGPPGYHTILLPILFWPGSLMTAAGIALAFRQGLTYLTNRAREQPANSPRPTLAARLRSLNDLRPAHAPYFFCLCWILPAWLAFEIVTTKLPHYTLPMYPAIALLSARAVLAAEARLLPGARTAGPRIGHAIWLGIGVALAFAMVLLVAYSRQQLVESSLVADLFVGALAVVGVIIALWNLRLAWGAVRSGLWVRAQIAGLFAFVVIWVILAGWAIPPAAKLSRDLVSSIPSNDFKAARPLAAVGYHEDSLVFLTRARVERITPPELDAWLARHPDGLVVMPLTSREPPPGLGVVGGADGFNYSKGRYLHLALMQRAP